MDLVLTLYPFEALVFKENSVKAKFVGHPVASDYLNIDYETLKMDARRDLKIGPDKKVVAILPGSRRSEVATSGKDFLETALELREHVDKFLIPAANPKRYQQLFSMLGDFPELQGKVRLIRGNSKKVMSASDVVFSELWHCDPRGNAIAKTDGYVIPTRKTFTPPCFKACQD